MNSNIYGEPMATFERKDNVLWEDANGEPLDIFQEIEKERARLANEPAGS